MSKEGPRTPATKPEESVADPLTIFETERHENKWESAPFLLAYKTVEEKVALSTSLRMTQMRPYQHAYMARVKEEIDSVIVETTTANYYKKLRESWNSVIEVNAAIDTFLYRRDQSPFAESWSLRELELSLGLLDKALALEHEKNIYSGGLKKKIDYEIQKAKDKYKLTEAEQNLLGTLSTGTFHERYVTDHERYFLATETEKPALYEELLKLYHGNDVQLFEARLKSFAFEEKGEDQMKKSLAALDENIRERAIKKVGLMAERPDLKDIETLLRFDNWDEYLYTYTYKAFPEAMLRERLTTLAIEEGEAGEGQTFLDFSHEEFLNLVEKLIEKRRETFHIELNTYRQNDDTCGTACVLTILEKRGIVPSEEREREMWERVGKPFNFPGGMAQELLSEGIPVTYLQFPAQPFSPNHPDIIHRPSYFQATAGKYVHQIQEAKKAGMQMEIKDFNFDDIKAQLFFGNLCILGVNAGMSHEILHWVIVNGYRKESGKYELEISDPLGNDRFVKESWVDTFTPTSMGKRLIVIEKLPGLPTPSRQSKYSNPLL